jgi:hypothetical protein
MQHAFEVPPGAVDGRVAVEVVIRHRVKPPAMVAE